MAVDLADIPRGKKLSAEARQRLLLVFGTDLRHYRKQAGLSQEALAKAMGVHHVEIGVWERGEREPRLITWLRLAWGLDLPPSDLIQAASDAFQEEQWRLEAEQ